MYCNARTEVNKLVYMYALHLRLIGQPFRKQPQINRYMTMFNMPSVPETVFAICMELQAQCRLDPCTVLAEIKNIYKSVAFGAAAPAGEGADLHDECVCICCNRVCA